MMDEGRRKIEEGRIVKDLIHIRIKKSETVRMRFIIFSLILMCVFPACFGKNYNFRYSAGFPRTDSTGFYKIQLLPEIISSVSDDASDLRIIGNGKEIPYLLRTYNPAADNLIFNEYEIAEKTFAGDSVTLIIIINPAGKKLNNVSLRIHNAEAVKYMKVSGSYDRKQWYVVKQSETINSISSTTEVSEIRLINFPLTNYIYYRIEIDDRTSPPLDIISAGYYTSTKSSWESTEIKADISFSDSSKSRTSWVTVDFSSPAFIDELNFSISSPAYYLRNANIYYENENQPGVKHYHRSFLLDSRHDTKFNTNHIKTKKLWIEINNGDNPPLKIAKVNFYQLNQYLIASLERDINYFLMYGDSTLTVPNYDLQYFTNVIPSTLPVIMPAKAEPVNAAAILAEKGFFSDKKMIWVVLILVVTLLSYATYRMLNEK
jgi:hypothetical protein